MNVGTNVAVDVDSDGIATIIVDLNARHEKSTSGKTTIVGSTHGAQKFTDREGNPVSVSLNVYTKA